MRIGPAANVARINVDEIITAFWIIGGVGLRNTAIDLLGLASPANRVLGCDVDGDADERFRLHAGGIMQWGDGAGARDTQLQRDAANELGTPDDFNVGGVLDLAGDIELPSRDIALASSADDLASGIVPVQRITPNIMLNISGFAGGRGDRVLILFNLAPVFPFNLLHDSGLSAAANRMILTNASTVVVGAGEGVQLWYDGTTSRWRILSAAV